MPKVSVIIPTYNRKEYVQEAIDSVLAQTFTDYEIIVVDDGSTDGTGEVLQAKYGDRIRYVWQENQGESVARNRGIEMAQGEYIALLDSDDLWLPEKLEKQIPVLEANPDAVLTFAQVESINERGDPIDTRGVPELRQVDLTLEALCLSDRAMVSAPCTALIRRRALLLVGGYDRAIRFGEDYDLFLRLRSQGEFAFVAEVLAYRRIHCNAQHLDCRPEILDERLQSTKTTLQKVFDNWPGGAPKDLRYRALADLYGRIGISHYVSGSTVQGRERIDQAATWVPEYWANTRLVASRLIGQMMFTAFLHDQGMESILNRVRKALGCWPRSMPLSSLERHRIMGQVYADLAFAAHRQHDWDRVRHCLPRVIWHNPMWLLNLGVWSIAADAWLGARLAGYLRYFGRKMIERADRG